MLKPIIISLALLSAAAPAIAEDEPTMHQVYLAAEAGKFDEAQSMMDKVLRAHPNSAKAHFVEAEILAKQGLLNRAADELSTAERLQPGLPFAKPEAVKSLKSRISSTSSQTAIAQAKNVIPVSMTEWMPWILLVLGIGLIVLLIGYFTRRNTHVMPANNYGNNAYGSNIGPNGAGPAMGQAAPGGTGSGIMSSLATGAALGAGVVAGEALMHHLLDDDKEKVIHEPQHHDSSPWTTAGAVNENNDMGGMDFGIADASSWEDAASSDGGSEWT
jgi:tetratricopeptide (TPR) repeat protein